MKYTRIKSMGRCNVTSIVINEKIYFLLKMKIYTFHIEIDYLNFVV